MIDFTKEGKVGGSLLGLRIKECKNQCNKAECWKRFDKGDV